MGRVVGGMTLCMCVTLKESMLCTVIHLLILSEGALD
jgi:hypothetical protein